MECWGWLGLIGIMGIGGAVVSMSAAVGQAVPSNIVPDATLGAESSQVIQNFQGLPVEAITGGAVRGANLFHSFQEFNVSQGRGAYFSSPDAAIQNILARVTGSNPSQILGTLGTFGSSQPSLFLINPNGIVFGPSASLDVGGSFVATTANAVLLGDTGRFSASDPSSSTLLTVNPSALFFNALNSQASIVSQSRATSTVLGTAVNGAPNRPFFGLQVLEGQNLLLVGGNVSLDGGILQAPGGRVELGGLAAPGIVGLTTTANQWGLEFPIATVRADVLLANNAEAAVVAGSGGTIAIHARNVTTSSSRLTTGIGQGLGSADSQAGDINISATGTVLISDSSFITNGVLGIGDSGNINISGQTVNISNGSLIGAVSAGQGNSGNVTIQAIDTISLSGKGTDNTSSGILSVIGSLPGFAGAGSGGDIYLLSQNLLMLDGAVVTSSNLSAQGKAGSIRADVSNTLFITGGSQLNASTFGQGDAGDVVINAGTATFEGIGRNGSNSGALSNVAAGAIGRSGNVRITANTLSVTNGAQLGAATFGQGDAGDVVIDAGTATFDGVGSDGFSSGVFSTVQLGAVGRGGSVHVTADTLFLVNGAQLNASTFGRGDAGDVVVDAGTASFDGIGSNGISSGVLTGVSQEAIGSSGNVHITAATLSVTNGAQVGAGISGQGDAGDIIIDAGTAIFDGISSNGFNSGAFSTVQPGAVGRGGSVRVRAVRLSLTNGAVLNAGTFGQGDAGDVIVDAGAAMFDGTSSNGFSSGAFSTVEPAAIGRGGNIRITANTLSLTNGAQLAASTFGQGNGGDVIIDVGTATLSGIGSNGRISGAFSTVESRAVGRGGNVYVTADTLSLLDGAVLNASTFAQGDAGDVIVNAGTATFDGIGSNGFSSAAGSIVGIGAIGRGGNVRITADTLSLTNGGALLVNSFGQGDAGSIAVDADFIRLDQGNIQAQTAAGNGGNITLDAENLIVLRTSSLISATAGNAQAGGNGGNVTINAPFIVAIPKENSDITANAFTGNGGNITITAQGIFGLQFRPALTPLSDITASSEFGLTGAVTLNSPDTSSLQNSLTEFPQTLIDPNQLLSTSCIVRRDYSRRGTASQPQGGSFFITGPGGLPQRPSDAPPSAYPTGTIRSLPHDRSLNQPSTPRWKPGDPMIEPQGVYQLADGRLVLSRECDR